MANCKIPKAPNGENSKLYSSLQSRLDDHLVANYVYAAYLSQGIAERMDQAGYARTKQGEHSAVDLVHYLNLNSLTTAQHRSIPAAQKEAGATDADGNVIAYASAEDALLKAQEFNQNNKGHVAHVVNRGSEFNIVVEKKDSRTHIQSAVVDEQLKLWTTLKDEFKKRGVDLDNIAYTFSSANALQMSDMMRYLKTLGTVPNNILSLQDIKTLIDLNPNEKLLATAVSRYGSAEEVANVLYNHYHGSPVKAGNAFITSLMQALKGSDMMRNGLTEISDKLNSESDTFRTTNEAYSIQKQLNELHEKYGIDTDYITVGIGKIETLSQAAATAAMTLEKQLRFLKKQEGRTAQAKKLSATQESLLKELQSKHYYNGLLTFMNQALRYAQTIDGNLRTLSPDGTLLEYTSRRAKVLSDAKTMRDGYYMLVKSLTEMPNLIIDESVSKEDLASLQEAAKEVLKILDSQEKIMQTIQEDTMLDLAVSVLGEEDYNGMAIANLLKMSKQDSSIMDFLYSGSRVSNPLLGAMNTIIRDSKRDRDIKMSEIAKRIRRANDKLRKAEGVTGVDTGFMYQVVNGEVKIIDKLGINWEAYYKARNKAYGTAKHRGLKGFALKEAMEKWEEDNTTLYTVDQKSGRQERVPSAEYQDASQSKYSSLTKAQKEYYDEVMQIKGEIGTMLPFYAQDQFRPAQIRHSLLDLFEEGIRGRLGAKDIAKSILDRLRIWEVKQDDSDFTYNGIIGDDEYGITQSDFKNHMMRQIPIFYFNKLENQKEVRMDFSGGLQALASTAINYDSMSRIRDVVELMANFIENQESSEVGSGKQMIDVLEDENFTIINKIKARANGTSNTRALTEGFLARELYGQKYRNEDSKWLPLAKHLLAYNSLKGLAMNLKGAVSNYLVGEYQMLIKAIGGTITGVDYNLKDYALAHAILFGKDNVLDAPGAIVDAVLHNKNTKAALLGDMFDPTVDNFSEYSYDRYYTNLFRRIVGGFNIMGMYSSGEYFIHQTNMYAILLHEKVWQNGEQISLYEALKVGNKQNGNSELVIDPSVTLDKEGTKPVTQEYLTSIKDKVRHANQNCHGSMAEEDKGLIHRRMAGKFVMNFRQWMVEHYSRRYRGKHWDASSHSWEEGYWITAYKFTKNFMKGLVGLEQDAAMRWENMDARSKQNVSECFTEIALLALLWAADMAIGPVKNVGAKDKDWDKWNKRFWDYQLKRLLLDAKAATPVGAATESMTIVNAPIPAVNTINGLMYPLWGTLNGDFMETYQRGPYKGQNKFIIKTGKYSLPWWYQIEQMKRMDEDESLFLIFNSDKNYR